MNLTAQQARDQLAATSTLTTSRDRLVHGLAVASYGSLIGAFIALQRVFDESATESVVMVGYVLLLLSVPVWQQRLARTAPRHSKRLGSWGLGGSLLLSFVLIAVLNHRAGQAERDGLTSWSEHWWVLVIAAVVIALPCLVAGHLIRHGDRR